jgi:hypothetical protein
VSKHLGVDDWNIQNGENSEKPKRNSPKEKLVIPKDIPEVFLALALELKQTDASIDEFPRQEEREPGQACESGCTTAEYDATRF